MSIQTVSIIGVGLIGGSFSLALKKYGFTGKILGVSRPQTIEKALEFGAIDEGATLEEAMAVSDLVYLAQPILRILDQLPEIARMARPGTLITDAGSTKAAIVEKAGQVLPEGVTFLGGHPMAGKEGRGVEIADPDLFQNAVWVLTPDGEVAETEKVKALREWITLIGARTMTLSPEEHDRIVALTSHVPQLTSTALAATVLENLSDPRHLAVAGGGLRDMTRLAGSSYEIWEGILLTNGPGIRSGLDRLIERLTRVRDLLENPALADEFRVAQKLHKDIKISREN